MFKPNMKFIGRIEVSSSSFSHGLKDSSTNQTIPVSRSKFEPCSQFSSVSRYTQTLVAGIRQEEESERLIKEREVRSTCHWLSSIVLTSLP